MKIKQILKNKPRLLFWIIFLLTLMLVISFIIINNNDDDTLVIVGEEKITKTDLENSLYGIIFDSEVELTDEEKNRYLSRLIERSIARQEAAKMGLKVTNEELDSEIKARLGEDFDKYSEIEKELTRSAVKGDLYIEKIKQRVISKFVGDVVLVRFDRAIQDAVPNWEDQYEKDKIYALELANKIYQNLISEKITMNQAKKIADEDKITGMPAWQTPDNFEFSKSYSINSPLSSEAEAFLSPDFTQKIITLQSGVISKPQIAKVALDEYNEVLEAFYFIAKPESISGGYESYEKWLEEKIIEYGLKDRS